MVHAAAAMKFSHRKVLIRTVDTAVVMLTDWLAQEMHELWLAFVTEKNLCYIAAYEQAYKLGPGKATALSVFHVASFAGQGKKTAWAMWSTIPEVTSAFMELASAPLEISQDSFATLKRFVVLLYDRTCKCYQVDLARKTLCKESSIFRRTISSPCSPGSRLLERTLLGTMPCPILHSSITIILAEIHKLCISDTSSFLTLVSNIISIVTKIPSSVVCKYKSYTCILLKHFRSIGRPSCAIDIFTFTVIQQVSLSDDSCRTFVRKLILLLGLRSYTVGFVQGSNEHPQKKPF